MFAQHLPHILHIDLRTACASFFTPLPYIPELLSWHRWCENISSARNKEKRFLVFAFFLNHFSALALNSVDWGVSLKLTSALQIYNEDNNAARAAGSARGGIYSVWAVIKSSDVSALRWLDWWILQTISQSNTAGGEDAECSMEEVFSYVCD